MPIKFCKPYSINKIFILLSSNIKESFYTKKEKKNETKTEKNKQNNSSERGMKHSTRADKNLLTEYRIGTKLKKAGFCKIEPRINQITNLKSLYFVSV